MGRRALILFVKNPVKGKVKTRLAATAGDDKALAVYQALVRHTREMALGVEAGRMLCYSDRIDKSDDWPEAAFDKFLQKGENLGQRMYNAFSYALWQYPAALLIGSDCPGLTPAHLEAAFEALNQFDVVLGPALDGGYYLIGLKKNYFELFDGIAWSTPQVLSATLERAAALGLHCHQLDPLPDIDTEADWNRYGGNLQLNG